MDNGFKRTHQEDQGAYGHKKKVTIIVVFLLLALLCLGGVLYGTGFFSNSWFDKNATEGYYDGKTEEEIIAGLNAKVAEGMMNISIAATIRFPSGSEPGEARIENIAANPVDQKVTITLDDTEETVYQSGAIAPGQYIQYITLARDLDPGIYEATAIFIGYDQETHKEKSRAGAKVKLTVAA